MMSENRRISLPVIQGLPYKGPLSPGYLSDRFSKMGTEAPYGDVSPSHLSPMHSPIPVRRSLPSTPRCTRRSLPGTPRSPVSPSSRSQVLPDLDEYFPASSSGTSSHNSSCEVSPRRRLDGRRPARRRRELLAMRDSGFTETESNPEKTQLRSFDVGKDCFVDRGFQPRKAATGSLLQRRAECRRATCPEIWLVPDMPKPSKRVLIRVYGNSCVGKNTVSHQIHHHASSAVPLQVNQSCECKEGTTRSINFLLNGEEIQLEIVKGSTLESTPFSSDLVMYVVVYSVTNRESLTAAAALLFRLHERRRHTKSPVILVGNKVDIKRSKVVSTLEGRMLAKVYKCGFVETSALMGMNVAELWKQVLQKMKWEDPAKNGFLSRIVERGRWAAKSCEAALGNLMQREKNPEDDEPCSSLQ